MTGYPKNPVKKALLKGIAVAAGMAWISANMDFTVPETSGIPICLAWLWVFATAQEG